MISVKANNLTNLEKLLLKLLFEDAVVSLKETWVECNTYCADCSNCYAKNICGDLNRAVSFLSDAVENPVENVENAKP